MDASSSSSAPNKATSPSPAPQRSPSQSSLHRAGISSHRQSFAENLRNPPPSPRQRHPSFTQQAVQDLMNHPPPNRSANPRFTGRNWRDVAVGELVSEADIHWVDLDMSVEDATKVLLGSKPLNVALVRENASTKKPISTFDYSDLNAYLLAVVGLAQPPNDQLDLYRSIATKAQEHVSLTMREIQPLLRGEALVALGASDNLAQAIEVFGSGVHRVIVANPAGEAVGVLSQLELTEFFWNEGVNFLDLDRLYPASLRDLQIGSLQIIAVNSDNVLADALKLMHNEGLTSVAVVDNGLNVVGNISTADVRLLTSTASAPLLQQSCMSFISVILSERGVEKGRDSFPVFHVTPTSTLAHTVAKLVATRSHRMWVVEQPSPSGSAPATPLLQPVPSNVSHGSSSHHHHGSTPLASSSSSAGGGPIRETTVLVPASSTGSAPQSPMPVPASVNHSFSSVPAAALPGAHLSGRLTGVVSLTDILNLFAKSTGLHPSDPSEQRSRRRRSSSSSVRPSMDGVRRSMDIRR